MWRNAWRGKRKGRIDQGSFLCLHRTGLFIDIGLPIKSELLPTLLLSVHLISFVGIISAPVGESNRYRRATGGRFHSTMISYGQGHLPRKPNWSRTNPLITLLFAFDHCLGIGMYTTSVRYPYLAIVIAWVCRRVPMPSVESLRDRHMYKRSVYMQNRSFGAKQRERERERDVSVWVMKGRVDERKRKTSGGERNRRGKERVPHRHTTSHGRTKTEAVVLSGRGDSGGESFAGYRTARRCEDTVLGREHEAKWRRARADRAVLESMRPARRPGSRGAVLDFESPQVQKCMCVNYRLRVLEIYSIRDINYTCSIPSGRNRTQQ